MSAVSDPVAGGEAGLPAGGEAAPPAGGEAAWRPLIDVSGVSLTELTNRGDDVIARAVQQVLRSLDDPNGVISAFESFVET